VKTVTLSNQEIDQYHHDGFVCLDRPLLPDSDVREVSDRIDRILARWSTLPPGRTIGKEQARNSLPQIVEIRGASILDPSMARLAVVEHCRRIASELLQGHAIWFHFDQVFYKQPSEETGVLWHQDRAYSRTGMVTRAVHMWVPLQDATEENGCVSYLPGSHRQGLSKHAKSLRAGGVIQRTALVDESTAVLCPVRLGGLVCHSPMTLHRSNPNRSGEFRRAWILQFGLGPWAAMRDLARPALVAVARSQIALARAKSAHLRVAKKPD
jgi:hypothetical protein